MHDIASSVICAVIDNIHMILHPKSDTTVVTKQFSSE